MAGFSERFEGWKKAFLSPGKALPAEAGKKAGAVDGLVNLGIAYLVTYAVIIFLSLIVAGQLGVAGLIGGIIGVVFVTVVGLIATLIVAGLMYIMAMILGGKADYGKLFYVMSVVDSPLVLAVGALTVVTLVLPILALLTGLAQLLLALYGLYLLTLAVDAVYKFGKLKAVITWLVPGIVVFVLAMVFAAAMAAMFLGGMGAEAYSMGGY